MKLKSNTKYLTPRENAVFLVSSVTLNWTWVFICMYFDRGDNRGLFTTIGFIILTSLILSFFFSEKKFTHLIKLILQFTVLSLLIFTLTLPIGLKLIEIFNTDWVGFVLPIMILSVSFYFILRQLFAFPNNKIAFWVIMFLPVITIIILSIIPFYNNVFAYDFGIGFPLGAYLTLMFLSIAILCRKIKYRL